MRPPTAAEATVTGNPASIPTTRTDFNVELIMIALASSDGEVGPGSGGP
jgi:hypothetical protein